MDVNANERLEEKTQIPPAAETAELETLLRIMMAKKASDLHPATGCPPVLRIDGGMTTLEGRAPIAEVWLKRLIEAIAPERHHEEFVNAKETEFAHKIPELAHFWATVFRCQRERGWCCAASRRG